MKKTHRFFLLLLIPLFVACSHTPQKEAEKVAVNFSKAMYNLNFDDAKKYCTPDASKILSFIASNIKEEDLKLLKKSGDVDVSVVESTLNSGDSTATVNLKISNYIQINIMSGKSTIEKEKEERVDLVKVKDKWLVDLHK
ncbi:DUF4878 domain-containing protein [uncultured Bacteroides sp.]|uniref:DUF4878 domain-containing protein n=1 Tax=uncultured Bacteroides sp. TaxID=162156 RepID=UPI002AAAF0FF|nr:DUF4878 domain-containing protein [uncultured Bacteroides sp.]